MSKLEQEVADLRHLLSAVEHWAHHQGLTPHQRWKRICHELEGRRAVYAQDNTDPTATATGRDATLQDEG